eukprot:scaffold1435_cov267-Pinguiococcus_pyrenoidosus.AAC.20
MANTKRHSTSKAPTFTKAGVVLTIVPNICRMLPDAFIMRRARRMRKARSTVAYPVPPPLPSLPLKTSEPETVTKKANCATPRTTSRKSNLFQWSEMYLRHPVPVTLSIASRMKMTRKARFMISSTVVYKEGCPKNCMHRTIVFNVMAVTMKIRNGSDRVSMRHCRRKRRFSSRRRLYLARPGWALPRASS